MLNPDRLRQRAFYLNFGYCPEQIYLKLKTSRKAQLFHFIDGENFLTGLISLLCEKLDTEMASYETTQQRAVLTS